MPRKRKSYVWSRLVWRELPAEEIPELGADDFLASDETIGTTPINKNKQTIYCDSFSDDNQNVEILCLCWGSCACFNICHCYDHCNCFNSKRSVRVENPHNPGYCFLNHPKIEENQILKWCLEIPKLYSFVGRVIILCSIVDLIKIFIRSLLDFLEITLQRYWYICQSTNERMDLRRLSGKDALKWLW